MVNLPHPEGTSTWLEPRARAKIHTYKLAVCSIHFRLLQDFHHLCTSQSRR